MPKNKYVAHTSELTGKQAGVRSQTPTTIVGKPKRCQCVLQKRESRSEWLGPRDSNVNAVTHGEAIVSYDCPQDTGPSTFLHRF